MLTRKEYNRYKLFHNPDSNVIFVYDYSKRCFIHEIKTEWLAGWTGDGCSLPYMAHVMEWVVNFQPN